MKSSWSPRAVAFTGALLIAGVVALAAYDIVRGYRAATADAARQLNAQARIIAEQTARSIAGVDIVLRHIARQHREGALQALGPRDLHQYLRDQTVGLVQIDGLLMIDRDGRFWASSRTFPAPTNLPNFAGRPAFEQLRSGKGPEVVVESAVQSDELKLWVFPIGRRLETLEGQFAGVIGARGRIDYYQQFYRDVQLDPGTAVSLLHHNGTLLARHPPVESALGKKVEPFEARVAAMRAGGSGPARAVSPVDGIERFVALQLVQGYPLAVVVTREVDAVLAGWRAQSIGSAARTLALSALAAFLVWLLVRQLRRLEHAHRSLEAQRERFALAVAGSDDGIWEHDFVTGRAFNSARARTLVGMPPGPEDMPLQDWLDELPRHIHPEDLPRRHEAMQAHLEGRTPIYEVDVRHRHPDGEFRWVRIRGVCVRDPAGKPLRMAGSISDVDARKRAVEALRESEERFALAVAGSNDGIIDWDVANDRMYHSERALQILGIDAKATVSSRAEWRSRVQYHPDDVKRMTQDLADFLHGKTDLRDGEYRVRMPDGSYRWIRHRNRCVRDASGEPVRVAGSISDIDAQKKAEERYQLAVEGAHQGLWDWDLATDMLFLSPRAQMLNFLEPGATLRPRKAWVALTDYHPEDLPSVRRAISAHLRGETAEFSVEYRVRHHSGSYHWYRQRGVALRHRDGKPYRMAGSMEDITEQKNAEQALRASEEQYRAIFNSTTDALILRDAAGRIVDVNRAWLEMNGFTRAQALADPHRIFASPEMEPRIREMIQRAVAGETINYQLQVERKGEVAHLDVHLVPVVYRGQAHCLSVARDITAQKRAEAERARLEDRLLQAKKLEAIGTLAGGIAHDFNNILAAILGYGEMAQKSAQPGSALRRHLDAVVGAGMRAKSLVERILAFSRSGMGERAPISVQAVVAEALDLAAASLPSGVQLKRKLEAPEATVMGDPTQIHQVVMNLCANAAQAIKGEGTITVRLKVVDKRDGMAATSALASGRYVRLRVSDTGGGIAANVLERIFDPFFTTKGVGVGTGLGLSLVHGIVTDLGGGIDVDSQPGQGATFTVYLPLSDMPAASAAASQAAPTGEGQSILLVDDEEMLVRLGEEVIAALGYEPVGFSSSSAALAAFRADPARFDAVLSDEAMPELTGSELAKAIRSLRPDIPIILMSGVVSPALQARAKEIGVAEVLSKPLVSADIARALSRVLKSKVTT